MKKPNLQTLTLIFAGLCLMIALPFMNQAAATTVISTFGSNVDGWTGIGTTVSWDSVNGNLAGSLQSLDADSNWAQVVAPAKFHGAWGTALNPATISADIKFVGSGTVAYPTEFAITDGDTTYFYKFSSPLPSSSSWHTYSVAMNASGWTRMTSTIYNNGSDGWYYWASGQGSAPLGTESLATVLQNVTDFHIRTDAVSGNYPAVNDRLNVDNVKLSWVPIPSTMLLLGSGLVGLGLLRRRWSLKK